MTPEEALEWAVLWQEADVLLFGVHPPGARAFIVTLYGHPPEKYESLHSN